MTAMRATPAMPRGFGQFFCTNSTISSPFSFVPPSTASALITIVVPSPTYLRWDLGFGDSGGCGYRGVVRLHASAARVVEVLADLVQVLLRGIELAGVDCAAEDNDGEEEAEEGEGSCTSNTITKKIF
ncbi:hypothetical protein RIF29_39913 [Crotalaria pallida]|uniref:Uncharacterized protein n=1 Tax=Crotalaria pallida TaxID=3830 RepID=A0AAN9E7K0_CROPI